MDQLSHMNKKIKLMTYAANPLYSAWEVMFVETVTSDSLANASEINAKFSEVELAVAFIKLEVEWLVLKLYKDGISDVIDEVDKDIILFAANGDELVCLGGGGTSSV
ncbi:hypothetical protein OGATHE_000281 [Ogataea polymorpha]|uniref:Uncharacterized protein n=1 Tax=Ogataea polymorpha TaxID=460523 RepID=A0A9P8PUT9_9ASCO|nr:hypothetical protein OGATHE_000281 [Ogataea polymorpha]